MPYAGVRKIDGLYERREVIWLLRFAGIGWMLIILV